jgi:hypothetical protein
MTLDEMIAKIEADPRNLSWDVGRFWQENKKAWRYSAIVTDAPGSYDGPFWHGHDAATVLEARVERRETIESAVIAPKVHMRREIQMAAKGSSHSITFSGMSQEEFDRLPIGAVVVITVLPKSPV